MEDIKLQDLRRYTVERRTQITALDSSSGRKFVVNHLGQIRIPDDDKDFRIEPVLEAADGFEIGTSDKTPRLTRESLARELKQYFSKGSTAHHEEEEE
ncbi:MAG TPA: hypothetical protein VI756_20090 [Blastocatellia bacterium]